MQCPGQHRWRGNLAQNKWLFLHQPAAHATVKGELLNIPRWAAILVTFVGWNSTCIFVWPKFKVLGRRSRASFIDLSALLWRKTDRFTFQSLISVYLCSLWHLINEETANVVVSPDRTSHSSRSVMWKTIHKGNLAVKRVRNHWEAYMCASKFSAWKCDQRSGSCSCWWKRSQVGLLFMPIMVSSDRAHMEKRWQMSIWDWVHVQRMENSIKQIAINFSGPCFHGIWNLTGSDGEFPLGVLIISSQHLHHI